MEKWSFLDQNYGLTPLEKFQFFDFFDFLFLYPRKAFFPSRISYRHFPGLYCLKKKFEKWPFLDQNHGLTRLQKCQFFDFLNFLFLYPRKAFFRSRMCKSCFPGLYCLKKKLEKWPFFWPKPWVNPFGIMSIFRLFGLPLFRP